MNRSPASYPPYSSVLPLPPERSNVQHKTPIPQTSRAVSCPSGCAREPTGGVNARARPPSAAMHVMPHGSLNGRRSRAAKAARWHGSRRSRGVRWRGIVGRFWRVAADADKIGGVFTLGRKRVWRRWDGTAIRGMLTSHRDSSGGLMNEGAHLTSPGKTEAPLLLPDLMEKSPYELDKQPKQSSTSLAISRRRSKLGKPHEGLGLSMQCSSEEASGVLGSHAHVPQVQCNGVWSIVISSLSISDCHQQYRTRHNTTRLPHNPSAFRVSYV